jgi:hypothetical protein
VSGAMEKISGAVSGVTGLALAAGAAIGGYILLKNIPNIKSWIEDITKGIGDTLSGAHQVVSPRAGVEAHGDAVRDALDAERRAWEAGDALEAERQNAIAWQEAYKSAVDAGSATLGWNPILQAATRYAGDLAVDLYGPGVTSNAMQQQADARKQEIRIQMAQERAERERREAIEAQRRAEEERRRLENYYKPAGSILEFFSSGEAWQGQREVSPGVYVSPSGAYQVIRDGQIVSSGSAGAVQGLQEMARRATGEGMYPGTNYRYEVVEEYQAKARAGDAAAAAWLRRFAPAGAV